MIMERSGRVNIKMAKEMGKERIHIQMKNNM